jgi:hypothetical protein
VLLEGATVLLACLHQVHQPPEGDVAQLQDAQLLPSRHALWVQRKTRGRHCVGIGVQPVLNCKALSCCTNWWKQRLHANAHAQHSLESL